MPRNLDAWRRGWVDALLVNIIRIVWNVRTVSRTKMKSLDSKENNHQQDAELHGGKGPELDGAEGNRSKNNEKHENKFDDNVDHNISSKFKAQSSKQNQKD